MSARGQLYPFDRHGADRIVGHERLNNSALDMLMNGPPGAGKSMLASRLPSILPPLGPRELLEVSMILSVAGHLAEGALTDRRPFRAPHHSASMAALVGGGCKSSLLTRLSH